MKQVLKCHLKDSNAMANFRRIHQQARGLNSTSEPTVFEKSVIRGDEAQRRGAWLQSELSSYQRPSPVHTPIVPGQLAGVQPGEPAAARAALPGVNRADGEEIPEHSTLRLPGHGPGYGTEDHVGWMMAVL
ncbi:uncharacterized protein WM294_009184 isoform 1-T1 [Sarcoramphus papa]